MANLDFGLFIKIMSRTQSNQDGEVLIAIRKANEMLGKAGLQWHQVVRGPTNHSETYSSPNPSFTEEIFRQAAQRAREQREYASDFSTDALRAKHARRDAEHGHQHEAGNNDAGWTHKGPGDFASDHRVYTQEPPTDEKIEDAARHQTESIEGEAAQTHWFVFAMMEPDVAAWLFEKRASHAFHRILFAQVCAHGELSDNQIEVCERMMKRETR